MPDADRPTPLRLHAARAGRSITVPADEILIEVRERELLVGRAIRPTTGRGPAVVVRRELIAELVSLPWITPSLSEYLGSLPSLRNASSAAPRETCRAAGELIERIGDELESRRVGYEVTTAALLTAILVELFRSRPGLERESGGPIAALAGYIRNNYTDALTLERLAARCNMSPTHLSHRFHQEMGRPLFAYINEVRIDRACVLLKRSSLSVVEIAYAVGYNSLSFFNRYFRRLIGASPTEYRRKIGQ